MSTILQGDSKEELKKFEDESVDLLCTDPPYGYSFMGKAWDKALPDIEIFKECYRVLKPGAFAFVMSAPRSDVCSRMAILLEDAGFRIDFTPIYWTYASGFPKAMNIGKMVDKRNGRDQYAYSALGQYLTEKITDNDAKCALTVGFSSTLVRFWRHGERIPNKATYRHLKSLYGLNDRFDELIEREEAEREVLLEKSRKPVNDGTGLDYGVYGTDASITTPATDAAKALDGSYGGFQPKPAVEVVIVAMKPLSEKTYVDQALKNGKGITWLDDCRIPASTDDLAIIEKKNGNGVKTNGGFAGENGDSRNNTPETGRFPANLLVSDDVLNDGIERKSGGGDRRGKKSIFGQEGDSDKVRLFAASSGSYSRFFSLDAWAQTLPFLAVPKASKSEKNKGLEGFVLKTKQSMGTYGDQSEVEQADGAHRVGNKGESFAQNHHPTVKPLKLMSYLITLGSRPGDTVLDPFCGSGTTILAAKELGRVGIGIEREEEYKQIADARLLATEPTLV